MQQTINSQYGTPVTRSAEAIRRPLILRENGAESRKTETEGCTATGNANGLGDDWGSI